MSGLKKGILSYSRICYTMMV